MQHLIGKVMSAKRPWRRVEAAAAAELPETVEGYPGGTRERDVHRGSECRARVGPDPAEVITPPPAVDYVKWAEDNIVFSKRESAFQGPYNRDLFGYFDEILRALSPDDPCRVVTLMKSAQLGSTVVANVFAGGSMDMDPCDFMFIHPTDDNASRWSKMKLMPFISGTHGADQRSSRCSRARADSVLYKERIDGAGAILISGANSPASTSQVFRS